MIAMTTSGCFIYGKGESIGYIYAVDDGIFWDKIYFKTSLDSSDTDCYLVRNHDIKDKAKLFYGDMKIKLSYDKHLSTIAQCTDSVSTDDEVYNIEISP